MLSLSLFEKLSIFHYGLQFPQGCSLIDERLARRRDLFWRFHAEDAATGRIVKFFELLLST